MSCLGTAAPGAPGLHALIVVSLTLHEFFVSLPLHALICQTDDYGHKMHGPVTDWAVQSESVMHALAASPVHLPGL